MRECERQAGAVTRGKLLPHAGKRLEGRILAGQRAGMCGATLGAARMSPGVGDTGWALSQTGNGHAESGWKAGNARLVWVGILKPILLYPLARQGHLPPSLALDTSRDPIPRPHHPHREHFFPNHNPLSTIPKPFPLLLSPHALANLNYQRICVEPLQKCFYS